MKERGRKRYKGEKRSAPPPFFSFFCKPAACLCHHHCLYHHVYIPSITIRFFRLSSVGLVVRLLFPCHFPVNNGYNGNNDCQPIKKANKPLSLLKVKRQVEKGRAALPSLLFPLCISAKSELDTQTSHSCIRRFFISSKTRSCHSRGKKLERGGERKRDLCLIKTLFSLLCSWKRYPLCRSNPARRPPPPHCGGGRLNGISPAVPLSISRSQYHVTAKSAL